MDEKLLERVRKLLRKAEGASTEHEAEAFTAKATELILKYGIDEAVLQQSGDKPDERVIAKTFTVEGYAKAKLDLLREVARGIGCDAAFYTNDRRGWSTGRAEVVGWESDMAAFEVLFASLQMQATTEAKRAFKIVRDEYAPKKAAWDAWNGEYNAMRHELWVENNQRYTRGEPQLTWMEKANREQEWEEEHPRPEDPGAEPPHGRAFMQSFLIGFAAAVGSRLRRQRAAAVKEADDSAPGTALAVRDRGKAVQEMTDKRWTYGGSRQGASSNSNSGYYSGRDAGTRANIGGTSVGGGRKAIGR